MTDLSLNIDFQSKVNRTTATVEQFTDWGSITERIAKGDRIALAEYYERFFDVMFSEVSRVGNLDEASTLDIVQDSMLKVIRSIKRIECEKQLNAWSRAVARNSTYDWLRRNRKTNFDAQLSDLKDNVESSLESTARIKWIEEQILEQTPEIQKLFSMRYRFGWTLKKIASHLGAKTGAVDGKLRRAIEKIKSKAQAMEEI